MVEDSKLPVKNNNFELEYMIYNISFKKKADTTNPRYTDLVRTRKNSVKILTYLNLASQITEFSPLHLTFNFQFNSAIKSKSILTQ